MWAPENKPMLGGDAMKKAKRDGAAGRVVLELAETPEIETAETAWEDRGDVWDPSETSATETAKLT
jgi:hypothetical protein